MTTNRSSEELEMRIAVEAWGRQRFPGARVVHELVTGNCRIDMAFIQRDHIAGVEIKSSRDVLDRLETQLRAYHEYLPEVWLCSAPKWEAHKVGYPTGRVIYETGALRSTIAGGNGYAFPQPATVNHIKTVPMLHLLWRSELLNMCARYRVSASAKDTMRRLVIELARKLTGDEIVTGVCRELRARAAFPERPASDAPIFEVAA